MNYGMVIKVLGKILMVEAMLMVPSLLVSLYYNQYDVSSFFISIVLTGIIGFLMSRKSNDNKTIKAKEGLAIVAFGWILSSFFGSLPFVFSGSVSSWIDAFFETVSGFTTTGATIINNVEALPKGILFWRSFTHWVGGMGILVFTVAILPTPISCIFVRQSGKQPRPCSAAAGQHSGPAVAGSRPAMLQHPPGLSSPRPSTALGRRCPTSPNCCFPRKR
mgnify:CR=1 FL=1